MARVRLTDPRRSASRGRRAVEDDTPYPGSVNQPDRQFKRRDQYDMDWETTNHPYPDMRHEWQDDARDEIGFGIPEGNPPTVASVRVAASKAVRAAVLLLGEKVDDEVIEAQARDFMAMSPEGLDRTLQRFIDSQELYVAQDDEDDDDEGDEDETVEASDKSKKAEDEDEGTEDEESKEASDKSKKAEDDEDEGDEESKEASDKSKKAEDDDADDADEDEGDDESKEASDKSKKAEDDEDDGDEDDESKEASDKSKKAEDDEDEDDEDGDGDDEGDEESKEASTQRRGPNELDIELTSASGMDLPGEVAPDPRLAQLFEDESIPKEGAEAEPKKAKQKKAGIKELGGQPRAMTAGQGTDDISGIWETAPDVSSVFR